MAHPESELIAFLRNELGPAERERVQAHLAVCPDCRGAHDAFQRILTDLPGAVPAPPEPNWGRYRAELRARIEAQTGRRPWWRHPVPLVASAAVAALLLAVVWLGGEREAPRSDLTAMEEVILGDRLDLLRQYPLVERLDLLEDLDVIAQLDRLAPPGKG